MHCCLGAVGWMWQAGLWEVLPPAQLWSLLLWQQQLPSAARVLCCGLLSAAVRVGPGEQQCLVAGQDSSTGVWEFLCGHDRGGGAALVCGQCHCLVLGQHFLQVYLAGQRGWNCSCCWGRRLEQLQHWERFSVAVWVWWSAAPRRLWLQNHWYYCGDLHLFYHSYGDHQIALDA